MIFDNQLRIAEEIIKSYHFDEPFHIYLRKYFRANKRFGSRDRKLFSNLAYNYFRIGHCLDDLSLDAKLIMSYYLLNNERTPFIAHHKERSPAFKELPAITEPLDVKLAKLGIESKEVFPFDNELSEGIDQEKFALSHLSQPDVWLRVNRGNEQKFEDVLSKEGVEFEKHKELNQTYKVPAKTNLEHLFKGQNVLFEVQDLSSQLVGELFDKAENWWDCCSGAGGKSLMLKDKQPNCNLFVSDVRESILRNLNQRFKENRIYNHKYAEINLATLSTDMMIFEPDKKYVHADFFDGIIVDAPCTGSGTWGRNPENLHYFKSARIAEYQERQKAIATNAVKFLKSGGHIYYITCSVFKAENEEVVEHLVSNTSLELKETVVVEGYNHGCDSMFAAKLVKA